MQAEGDTPRGLRAEPKAAQTLPLWHTVSIRLLWVLGPRHHAGLTPVLGEKSSVGEASFQHLKANIGLPTINQRAF